MNQRRQIVLYGCIALLSTVPLHVFAADTSPSGIPANIENASWVWGGQNESSCHLRKVFSVKEPAACRQRGHHSGERSRTLTQRFASRRRGSDFWQSVERYDVKSRLTKGQNVIGIRGVDLGGVRGVIASLRIEFKKRKTQELLTDGTW